MDSTSQVQEIFINSNTNIECSILSQSTGDLQLAVIWYFSPISMNATWLRILEMDQTNVVKYGDEFHSLLRQQKFHPKKVSQDLFQLQILNVEDSDQGRYHCAVEEWFLSRNGTWHKLGEKKSGLTELKLRPTGKPHECILTTAFYRMAFFSWAALQWSDYVEGRNVTQGHRDSGHLHNECRTWWPSRGRGSHVR